MKIELSEQDIGLVLAALGKLPLEVSLDTWTRIRAQYAQAARAESLKAKDTTLQERVSKANGEDAEVQALIATGGE